MLINPRGSSGAGKSFIARHLLANYPYEIETNVGMFTKQKPKVIAYHFPDDLVLLGNYSFPTSGGLDGFRPMDNVKSLIRDFGSKHKYVVYESLLLSQQVGFIYDLVAEFGDDIITIAPIDTPVETCIARIYRRNGGKPIKEKTVVDAYNRVHSLGRRFTNDGLHVVTLDHKNVIEEFMNLLPNWNGGTA